MHFFLTKAEETLDKTIGEAGKRLGLAEKRLLEADERYEKADGIAGFFEDVADKEKKKLKNLLRKVTRINEEIRANRVELKKDMERLNIKEIQVKDKQEALDRAYREIQAKARKLNIVL